MKTRAIVLCLAGGLAAGCGHGSMSERASNTKDAIASTFESAYDSVKSGAKSTARYGGYVIDRAGEGSVRVYREARSDLARTGDNVSDAFVTTKIKGKLATDGEVHSRDIDVETDAGVVTLKGTVHDEHEASKAVEDALETGGVFAVNAELSWPTRATGQRDTDSSTF